MGSQKKKIKPSTLNKYKRVIDVWLNNGENGTQAYKEIYPSSSDANAKTAFHKILTFSDIQKYIKNQKKVRSEKAKEKHNFTFEQQIEDQMKKKRLFEMLVELGTKEKLTKAEKERFERLKSIININGINKADDILNKMLGFDAAIKIAETDSEGNDKINYSELSTEELIKRAKAVNAIKLSQE